MAIAFAQERHGMGAHLRLAEVGHSSGPADGLAATRRRRPCQGKLKSSVFASCHEDKQQQRFSGWNSCLAVSVSCPQLPPRVAVPLLGPPLSAPTPSILVYPGSQERSTSSQTRRPLRRSTDLTAAPGEVNGREAKAAAAGALA